MTYRLEILPAAVRDMVQTARYISRDLGSPEAAERLAQEITEAIDRIPSFPYANPAYAPIRPLEREYRKVRVQNYLIFYWVSETAKTTTVARVIYARRNMDSAL